jgi:hypothetical protein
MVRKMKKIITIVLAIACAFTLFSCGGSATEASIDEINSMYNAISPSRVEVVTTQSFGKFQLKTTQTLVTGIVDGFAVTVFEESKDQFRDIESGAGNEIVHAIETVKNSWVYHEDLGYRENGGKWDLEADDPTPATGAIALNLSAGAVEDFNDDEEKKTVTFKVLPENSEDVFGYEIPAEASVTIVHSGADIVSVTIAYTVVDPDNDMHPEIDVVIEAKYSYVAQQVTFD